MNKQETIECLLDLLPILADRGWHSESRGELRSYYSECPICALVNEIEGYDEGLGWSVEAKEAVADLMFGYQPSGSAVISLMVAADGEAYPDLRARMEYALGLDNAR